MKVSESDILILPGLGGGTPEHWYNRWAQKLSTARRVEQRDFDNPRFEEWSARVGEAVAAASRPVVLVGHSLGAVTACLIGARLPGVAAAMLVAPAAPRALLNIAEVDKAFAHEKAARLPYPCLLVASRNDPYATYEESTERAAMLGATLVDAGESGHINPDSGHGPWPEGLMRFAHFLGTLKAREN
ncbi:MAG: RBBP9/YdeN family alpha/beta hydrolase [Rhodoblastus sp.]